MGSFKDLRSMVAVLLPTLLVTSAQGNSTQVSWAAHAGPANTIPPVPSLQSPRSGFAVPYYAFRLTVQNVHDPDTDPRTQNFDSVFYDFEIFDDSLLTNRVAQAARVPAEFLVTRSSEFNDLALGARYWWHARARDPYESSDWSAAEHFVTRSAMVFSVAATQDGIGGGIASAWDGDTVLVGPGHAELWAGIQIFYRRIVLKSQHGPHATFLRNENAGDLIRIGDVTTGPPGHGAVLDGFTVRSDRGQGIFTDRAEYTVRNCVFDTVAGHSIVMRNGSATIRGCDFHPEGEQTGIFVDRCALGAHHNLFTGGFAQPLIYLDNSSAAVWNNTFVSCWSGVGLIYNGTPVECINNLFVGLGNYAISGSLATVDEDYNLFHANLQNTVGEVRSGGHSTEADPLFDDYPGAGYMLSSLSPAIDAGHPGPVFRDNDGSISDIGAFGHWTEPHLLSPLNETVENLRPRFEWNAAPLSGVTYTLMVSSDSTFKEAEALVLDTTNLNWPTRLTGGTHYFWQVLAYSELGTRFQSAVGEFDAPIVPSSFALLQNYPNPFNAQTVIPVELPQQTDWSLTIYNVLGQPIRKFRGTNYLGRVFISWDGQNEEGVAAASGLYPYRFDAGSFIASNKMVLLR